MNKESKAKINKEKAKYEKSIRKKKNANTYKLPHFNWKYLFYIFIISA